MLDDMLADAHVASVTGDASPTDFALKIECVFGPLNSWLVYLDNIIVLLAEWVTEYVN